MLLFLGTLYDIENLRTLFYLFYSLSFNLIVLCSRAISICVSINDVNWVYFPVNFSNTSTTTLLRDGNEMRHPRARNMGKSILVPILIGWGLNFYNPNKTQA